MKEYPKKRLKTYIFVILGILIGFIIGTFLWDNPDYTTALIAVILGLTIGEVFVFRKWLKEENKIQPSVIVFSFGNVFCSFAIP